MQLNLDCVRKILLTVEDKQLGEVLSIQQLENLVQEFNGDEIEYCCLKLDEAGFLEIETIPILGQIHRGIKFVKGMTYGGHQFLENIRDDNIFKETKERASAVGAYALGIIAQIAINIITSKPGF